MRGCGFFRTWRDEEQTVRSMLGLGEEKGSAIRGCVVFVAASVLSHPEVPFPASELRFLRHSATI